MITVLLDKRKFKGGPAVFRSRLIHFLKREEGIKLTHDYLGSFDVELSFIRLLSKHKKPRILRVDGCYYVDTYAGNKPIAEAMKKVQHVIYQSYFSRKMVQSIVLKRKKKPNDVIHNGIDFEALAEVKPDPSIEPGSFVTVSNRWRHTKRPLSTLLGFMAAATDRHLYVIGDEFTKHIDRRFYSGNKRIHVMGKLPGSKILSIMKASQYQIHLCHIDSCPNAVIEGLACGLNVLCTNLGGTPELVKEDGVIMKVDGWHNQIMSRQNLDKVKPEVTAQGIHKLLEIETKPDRPDLDIRQVSHRYAETIRKVMS